MARTTMEKLNQTAREIGSVEDFRLGDHICLLFKSEEDQLKALVPFLNQGFVNHEKVVYLYDAPTPDKLISMYQPQIPEFDAFLATRQLCFLPINSIYLQKGVFSPETMMTRLREEIQKALEEGFSGFRFTSESTWILRYLLSSRELKEFHRLNEFLPSSKALALCQFDQRRFPPETLLEVLDTHPVIILENRVIENFYFVPPTEVHGPARISRDLQFRLNNLCEHGNASRAAWALEALRESEHLLGSILRTRSRELWFWTPIFVTSSGTTSWKS